MNQTSLKNLLDIKIQLWDESGLAADKSSKKRRVAPAAADETPATKALEQFLRFAADESNLTMALPLHFDSDMDDASFGSFKSVSSCDSSCSLLYKSKKNFRFPNMHDVTRGMAEISHH